MPQILSDSISSTDFDDLEARRLEIQRFLKANVASEVRNGRILNGRFLYYNGWKSMNLQSAFKSSIFAVMAQIFFGEMATEPEFAAALSRYPRDLGLSASTKQYAPRVIAPIIEFIMTRNESAKQTLARRLTLVIDQSKTTKVHGVLQSLITSARSKADVSCPSMALAETILNLWLIASHQSLLVLVYTVFRACTRILDGEKMRREIGDQDQRTCDSLNSLPLLHKFMMQAIEDNSFIKGSISADLLPESQGESKSVMSSSLTDTDFKAAAKTSRPLVFLAAKITVSHFLTNFNARIAEETSLHLKDSVGKSLQASEIRILVRDRHYIEENYL
ncbi:hypothetical protein SBOR_8590 [Sclerotinia borealis F-4128]|uniref:Uncharacterized protein n=1 Tax=Sclerotinia borealis (strain F-4128) TaxID=1432307 RepID=W9C822_SCLBF|nr:hypothetical protein SBOR_8590 [Sclerotinia borealis F-4128]